MHPQRWMVNGLLLATSRFGLFSLQAPKFVCGLATRRRASLINKRAVTAMTTPTTSSPSDVEKQNILCILSPAKTMDGSDNVPDFITDKQLTLPDCDNEKTREIVQSVKSLSKPKLKSALKLSDKLADSTHKSWRNVPLELVASKMNHHKPCIYCYSGAAFQGLNIKDCELETIQYLQTHLRILDAVFGCLRPLDQIPSSYRLEMNTKLDGFPKLTEYWKESVTAFLQQSDSTILLNLASNEYSSAIDWTPFRVIQVAFRVNGRVVAVHAKRARGLMVRYLAQTKADSLQQVKQFDAEGYQFVEDDSDETTLVFEKTGDKQPAQKRAASSKKRPSSTTKRKRKA